MDWGQRHRFGCSCHIQGAEASNVEIDAQSACSRGRVVKDGPNHERTEERSLHRVREAGKEAAWGLCYQDRDQQGGRHQRSQMLQKFQVPLLERVTGTAEKDSLWRGFSKGLKAA